MYIEIDALWIDSLQLKWETVASFASKKMMKKDENKNKLFKFV